MGGSSVSVTYDNYHNQVSDNLFPKTWSSVTIASRSREWPLIQCKQTLSSPFLVPQYRTNFHLDTSNMESLPPPPDDDLSNLNWMHHEADELQVNVIGTSSEPPIAETSEGSDFSSLWHTFINLNLFE
ncbi:hypothetical protein ACROYT_G025140 [Oculina patagonica]